jgi:hypothetical protein
MSQTLCLLAALVDDLFDDRREFIIHNIRWSAKQKGFCFGFFRIFYFVRQFYVFYDKQGKYLPYTLTFISDLGSASPVPKDICNLTSQKPSRLPKN